MVQAEMKKAMEGTQESDLNVEHEFLRLSPPLQESFRRFESRWIEKLGQFTAQRFPVSDNCNGEINVDFPWQFLPSIKAAVEEWEDKSDPNEEGIRSLYSNGDLIVNVGMRVSAPVSPNTPKQVMRFFMAVQEQATKISQRGKTEALNLERQAEELKIQAAAIRETVQPLIPLGSSPQAKQP